MLKKIHCVFTTHPFKSAGTGSKPVLILGDSRRDVLYHTFEPIAYIEGGSSHFFTIDVANRGLPNYYQYIRLGIQGDDLWIPESVFIFGELEEPGDYPFQPIAMQYYSKDLLSTDELEGRISVPLNRATIGGVYTELSRLLIIIRNADGQFAGTNSPITLTVQGRDEELLRLEIPAGKLAAAGATYFKALWFRNIESSNVVRDIKVHIGGDDQWTPSAVYIFGVDRQVNEYEQVVPLVYIPDWQAAGLGSMSEDSKEGKESVVLYQAYL